MASVDACRVTPNCSLGIYAGIALVVVRTTTIGGDTDFRYTTVFVTGRLSAARPRVTAVPPQRGSVAGHTCRGVVRYSTITCWLGSSRGCGMNVIAMAGAECVPPDAQTG